MDDHKDRLTTEKLSQFMIEKINEWLIQSPDQLEASLSVLFKQVGAFFDMDRMGLFLYEASENIFHLVVEWCHLGIKPRSQKTYGYHKMMEDSQFIGLKQGQAIIYESLLEDKVHHTWLSHLIQDQVKAFYAVPLISKDLFLGYLTFENQRRAQSFAMMEEKVMKLFYQTIALRIANHYALQDNENLKEKASLGQRKQYTFVANISHEIRTPLNGIHNALYLLQTTDISKEQKNYLEMAQLSMDQITSIVDRIMDLEALESGQLDLQKRSFNLEDEMIRLIKMYQRSIEQKKLNLIWNYDYLINHEVVSDDRKIRHILSHLIQNAVKFTHEGDIELSIKKEKDIFIFEVRDTGIGISDEHLDHLYDAFFQIDMSNEKEFQGLGIGLTVASELTKLLGGTLQVESLLGQGSLFRLTLPLEKGKEITFHELNQLHVFIHHDKQISQMKPMMVSMGINVYDEDDIKDQKADIILFETPLKQGETLHQIKDFYGQNDCLLLTLGHFEQKRMKKVDGALEYPISRTMLMQKLLSSMHEVRKSITSLYTKVLTGTALIVDDNRLNRIALESILKKLGIKSILLDSGAKAIEFMKTSQVDLILMDIQMPQMDGLEATRRIRSLGDKCQTVPIVAVTANAYFNDYDLLKAAQINDVIFKPIQMESLGQILRKYLGFIETIRIPDEVISFDKNDFLKRFEGSYDIAKEVIETFTTECPKDLEKIRIAIETKQGETILGAAHYYKGSCAYLSGKRLVWLLNRMMDDARINHLDDMLELQQLLIKETEDLLHHLKSMHVLS